MPKIVYKYLQNRFIRVWVNPLYPSIAASMTGDIVVKYIDFISSKNVFTALVKDETLNNCLTNFTD